MRRTPPILSASLVLCASLAVWGCAVNPVTQRREVVFMSEEEERAVGEKAAKQVDAEMGLLKDPKLVAYVEEIGGQVAARSPRQSLPYRFGIVDQEEPNAFALPGGYVYVSRGLMVVANTEDELANALAHEVVHVAGRHHVQRQTRAVGVGILSLPTAIVGSAIGGSIGQAFSAPMAALGGGLIASYSRDQEREADRVGQEIAAQSGYDPRGLTRLMHGLESAEQLRGGEARMPGFFDTHPTTPERAADAERNAREVAFTPRRDASASRAAYLRRIEGMLVGQNPAEGVFEGSRFLHPDLGFTLRFPQEWKTANSRKAVGAIAPKEDGWVVLQVLGRGDDPRAAGAAFLREPVQNGTLAIERSEELLIGDLPAFHTFGVMKGRRGKVGLDITMVAFDGLVYGILGAAPAKADQPHSRAFRQTATSFRALRPEERSGVKKWTLQVATARDGESVETLSRRTANQWSAEQTAAYNGLSEGASLRGGQLVKVAVERPY